MTRSLLPAIVAAATLAACSAPSVAKCSQNSDCPADAICVTGICQKGTPAGGSSAPVAGAHHLTSGTLTMDATIGPAFTPAGSAGTLTMKPAENNR